MPDYRAVLFDLDGTLLDTLQDLADSMNAVLDRRGLPVHPAEAYKLFIGDGLENLVRRALPQGSGEDLIRDCVTEMRAEYGRRWADTTRPYAGVPEMLDLLAARGVPLAILSNKPHDFTELTVAKLLSAWRFAAVLGQHPGGSKKPDPTGALEIAAQLRLPPASILYLGDSGTDMQTARAAGMYAVGVLWGFRSASELTDCGAERLIVEPGELPALV